MLVQFKDGVVYNANKYTNAILEAAQRAYGRHGVDVLVVTAGSDGKHGQNSYHYKHRALDLRFWGIKPENREAVAQTMRDYLPPFYDVVVEADHYHVEADEKKEKA
jgi:hypothetical protein